MNGRRGRIVGLRRLVLGVALLGVVLLVATAGSAALRRAWCALRSVAAARSSDRAIARHGDSASRLSIVIDDFGYADSALVAGFIQLDTSLSVAVLPYQPHSRLSAELAHRAGNDVLLHLPMEGRPGSDPGPHALLSSLGEAELRARTRQALLDVPYVVGTNNHMGSVLTADATRMRWVLEEVRDRRLFFIDSRTTARSVAATLSREMGIPSASRRVFLDDSRGFADIEREWARALRYADTEGSALSIGHVYPETLAALRLLVARDRARVTLVRARELAR